MKQAIETYLTYWSDELHPDIPAEGRETMIQLYREDLLDFSRFTGDIDAAEVRPEHVARYAAALDEAGLQKLHKEIKFSKLRDFCGWLVRAKVLRKNPVPSRLCGSLWQRSWVREAIRLLTGTL